jgi:hypothetical protein
MNTRFQYADGTVWEGQVERTDQSPDKGVLRMWAIDDQGRMLEFVYDDFYYVYPHDGGWVFGSGTPKRDFHFRDGRQVGVLEMEVTLPKGAVVRLGQTVSQEDAVKFGLVDEGGKKLTPPRPRNVKVER